MRTIDRVPGHLNHGLLPLLFCAALSAQIAPLLEAHGNGTLIPRYLFYFIRTAPSAEALRAGAIRERCCGRYHWP